jgi:glucuronate isomerase
MNSENPTLFRNYVLKLIKVTGYSIKNFEDYVLALRTRHDFFHHQGCRLSDHGLEEIYAEDFTESEIKSSFLFLLSGKDLDQNHRRKFKSALLKIFAYWDHERGWVQQFHLGGMRNNNSRLYHKLGADTGSDSIGDYAQARSLSKFLDGLDRENKLARTIIYNLNPADNAVMAAMIGNFCDGSVPGKIQWGSAWWFLDQKDGMISQLNSLSNMGLLSRFVGMLTDSRSFLSYPRHEYFRRILCDLFGTEINNGEIPNDPAWVGKIIQDICFHNAKNYFDWPYSITEG